MEQARQRQVLEEERLAERKRQQEERKRLKAALLEPRVVEEETGDVLRITAGARHWENEERSNSSGWAHSSGGGCSRGRGVFESMRLEVVEKRAEDEERQELPPHLMLFVRNGHFPGYKHEDEVEKVPNDDEVQLVLLDQYGDEVHRFNPSEVVVVEKEGNLCLAHSSAERKDMVESDRREFKEAISLVMFQFSRTEDRINALLSGLRRLQEGHAERAMLQLQSDLAWFEKNFYDLGWEEFPRL